MRVLVVGATGFLGGAVARHLASLGHDVTGVVRAPTAEDRLPSGVASVIGDLDERLDAVVTAARAADAVVFAPQVAPEVEYSAVATILDAVAGTDTAFLFTSGTGVLMARTWGAWSQDCFGEDDAFTPEPLAARRVDTEALVRAAADRGVRSLVLRLPMIWGPGDHSHLTQIYDSVAVTGSACYIGEGLNCYSNLHVDDAVRLYDAALRRGRPGALHHGVAGEMPVRWLAEAVARDLGCATRSLTEQEATEVFGEFGALILGSTSRTLSRRTRAELDWAPRHTDMLGLVGDVGLRERALTGSR